MISEDLILDVEDYDASGGPEEVVFFAEFNDQQVGIRVTKQKIMEIFETLGEFFDQAEE